MTVEVSRKDGRFGMGHDEHNRVVKVHPGSAAEDAGLRVGDAVSGCDGRALEGLLTAALQGKERVVLRIVRRTEQEFEWSDLRRVAAEAFGARPPAGPRGDRGPGFRRGGRVQQAA